MFKIYAKMITTICGACLLMGLNMYSIITQYNECIKKLDKLTHPED